MQSCISSSSDSDSSSILPPSSSSSRTTCRTLLCPFLLFFDRVFLSASANSFCISSVETMNFPLSMIHLLASRSFHALITLFSSAFSRLNTELSAWRCSAIPLNFRPCCRIGVAKVVLIKASLKALFADRRV